LYIQYTMDQLPLPMDLEDDIPPNHLVRVINGAVNRLDDKIFRDAYHGSTLLARLPKRSVKISCLCGLPADNAQTSGPLIAFALSE
jgi:transposase